MLSETEELCGGRGEEREAQWSCESSKGRVVTNECGVYRLHGHPVIRKRAVLILCDLPRSLEHPDFLHTVPALTTTSVLLISPG